MDDIASNTEGLLTQIHGLRQDLQLLSTYEMVQEDARASIEATRLHLDSAERQLLYGASTAPHRNQATINVELATVMVETVQDDLGMVRNRLARAGPAGAEQRH